MDILSADEQYTHVVSDESLTALKEKRETERFDVPREVWIGSAVLAMLVLIIFGSWYFFIRTETVKLTVEKVEWTRRIQVLDFQPRYRSGWDHPSDAYNIDREWRVHHYYSMKIGESCSTDSKGNRTCTDITTQIPVYQWWYRYTVNRWEHATWLTTGGDETTTPEWYDISKEGFVPPRVSSSDVIGNRQEGRREEDYRIRLSYDGDTYEETTTLDVWKMIKVGDYLTGHISTFDLRSVEWPTPQQKEEE